MERFSGPSVPGYVEGEVYVPIRISLLKDGMSLSPIRSLDIIEP